MLFLDVDCSGDARRRLEEAFELVETRTLSEDRPGARLPRVQRYAGGRPMAWLAIAPGRDAYVWASRRAKRGPPTLMLVAAEEITSLNVETLLTWARRATRGGDAAVVDIGSTEEGPAGVLSNFAAHAFEFRGRPIASMEGLLQSLKPRDPARQREIQGLSGSRAKNAGSGFRWCDEQTLFWDGEPLDRHGVGYQALLDEAYEALFAQNARAREALLATGDAMLDHAMGKHNAHETVLTIEEFCSRLERIRRELAT